MKRLPTGNAARNSPFMGEAQGRKHKGVSSSGRRALRAASFALAALFISIGFILASAAEKPAPAPSLPPRIPEMSVAGKVLEISETTLKIERTLKGAAEVMEFVLTKPCAQIAAGDQVKVSYQKKEGQNILTRVAPAQKTAVPKAVKKELPKEMKPVAPPTAPAPK